MTLPGPNKEQLSTAEEVAEEQIVERIFEAVIEQRLPPGTKLSESALCQAFGVGRMRIRRSLLLLASREVVEACVSSGVYERPRVSGVSYRAFVDPSGGSNDAMTLAIGHTDDETAVLDAVRERRPPFSPEAVVAEFCALLKAYGVTEVTGDRYAGEWPRERFRVHGITYLLAEKPRSDLYRDMLPMLNSVKADLLDHARLVNQIVGLERRVTRGGRESIDHAPNGHDDIANAVAGVISLRPRPVAETVTGRLAGLW